jgi:hypothetical protein
MTEKREKKASSKLANAYNIKESIASDPDIG